MSKVQSWCVCFSTYVFKVVMPNVIFSACLSTSEYEYNSIVNIDLAVLLSNQGLLSIIS